MVRPCHDAQPGVMAAKVDSREGNPLVKTRVVPVAQEMIKVAVAAVWVARPAAGVNLATVGPRRDLEMVESLGA